MTKHSLMSLQLSMQSRYLKLGVVVHPAHRSRSHCGFLGAVHSLQSLHNQIYRLEMTQLPVSDREAGGQSQLFLMGVDIEMHISADRNTSLATT